MHRYWIVGATWGGHDDQSDKFIQRGHWSLGWDDTDQPRMAKMRNQIRVGDRIAIKTMLGRGSPNIKIKALGIVKDIDRGQKTVYINWLVTDLRREVPGKGCFGSIHGPFSGSDNWTKTVFCI